MMKKLLLMFVILMISITVFSTNMDNHRKNGSSKALKKSCSNKNWNHKRKIFKIKYSNSHLSNERKNVVLKRMY